MPDPALKQDNSLKLPEGLELVGLQKAGSEDYVLIGTQNGPRIFKGEQLNSVADVVVKPAAGYVLKTKFDPRDYVQFFRPVKSLDPLTIKQTVTFVVTDVDDRDDVQDALNKLKELRGFVSLDENQKA